MSFLEAVGIVLIPFIPILLPGIFFIRTHVWGNTLLSGSRIILWSMGSLTLLLTLGLVNSIPVQTVALVVTLCGTLYALLYRERFFTRQNAWHLFAFIIPVLLVVAVYTIPFLFIHDGLPSGDVQKTIIWAQESIRTHKLPNYQSAIELLNRDPVDFYTPGLHAISALVLSVSPSPLISIGIFSIVLAVGVAWIAASIAKEIFDTHVHVVPPLLAALFTLTQFRYLRYLREPGYHFQNIAGELFLFGMVLVFIRFIRRKEKQDAALFIICGGALFLTHQFSAFIAAFVLVWMGLAILFVFRKAILRSLLQHAALSTVFSIACTAAVAILFSLGLSDKIPSLFTLTPHLTSLLVPITSYPSIMGAFWIYAGFFGIVLMCMEARRQDAHYRQVMVFIGATIALLILSQGPALGIDIPPVRALFYLVVPFSVSAAYFFSKLLYITKKSSRVLVALAILIAVSSSTHKAFATLSHTVRTNSTLTAAQQYMIETLRGKVGGVLIDDYSRKSASWLTLADIPMFTRIGADLERQMEESHQSHVRKDLYLKQLDFEKIVELGSLPEIETLFTKNNIKYVTGISGASYIAFAHNPALHEVASADDITLFEIQHNQTLCVSVECRFLLRPSTLANDIGDESDTYEYLQASIRSPRLSEPKNLETMTYREVSSPIIPLSFNVGDYVRVLWDPNGTGKPETSLTFMIWLTKPVQGLSLDTPSGKRIALPYQKHITVELPIDLVQINEKGFISFSLLNPREEDIPIDLISLGTSLVP